MKKLHSISIFLLSGLIIYSCSPKVAKNTSSTNSNSEQQSGAREMDGDKVVETTMPLQTAPPRPLWQEDQDVQVAQSMQGKVTDEAIVLYQNKCSKCHELSDPQSRRDGDWIQVMAEMRKKAKLNPEEYREITRYLIQNAKK
ncbi:MAG: hypothetical protein R2831_00855 [Chitinophagaceae bacterium]